MKVHKRSKRLVTLDDAVEHIRIFFNQKKPPVAKGTLYNAISSGRINRYGPYKPLMVDLDEIEEEFCKDYKADEAG